MTSPDLLSLWILGAMVVMVALRLNGGARG